MINIAEKYLENFYKIKILANFHRRKVYKYVLQVQISIPPETL